MQNLVLVGSMRKGLFHDLRNIIEEKFEGKLRMLTHSKLPRDLKFKMVVVVDDECGACPMALEASAEVAAYFPQSLVTVYNISYVEPPFDVKATPTFQINNIVRFEGIPIDAEAVAPFLDEYIKKGYVLGHPSYDALTSRLKKYAMNRGYYRVPDDNKYLDLLYRLLRNIDRYGYPYCPCRPLVMPKDLKEKSELSDSDKELIHEKNKDKVCPCPYAPADIMRLGACICNLFWSKEKLDRFIKEKWRKYGPYVEKIKKVGKELENMETHAIRGTLKERLGRLINELQIIYMQLGGEG